jgi:hypothetical protein
VKVGKAATEKVGLSKSVIVGGMYSTMVGGTMSTTVGLMQSETVGLVKNVSAGKKIVLSCGEAKLVMESSGNITLSNADGAKISLAGSQVSIEGARSRAEQRSHQLVRPEPRGSTRHAAHRRFLAVDDGHTVPVGALSRCPGYVACAPREEQLAARVSAGQSGVSCEKIAISFQLSAFSSHR